MPEEDDFWIQACSFDIIAVYCIERNNVSMVCLFSTPSQLWYTVPTAVGSIYFLQF
jgi:hypothetical protein